MTELQLEFIRKFGRKELSMGCLVKWIDAQEEVHFTEYIGKINEEMSIVLHKGEYTKYEQPTGIDNSFEILGHPVQWHDVFERFNEKNISCEIIEEGLGDAFEYTFYIFKEVSYSFTCNPCKSPMEQSALIEQLLLLIK